MVLPPPVLLELMDAHNSVLADLHHCLTGVITGQESSHSRSNEHEHFSCDILDYMLSDKRNNQVAVVASTTLELRVSRQSSWRRLHST